MQNLSSRSLSFFHQNDSLVVPKKHLLCSLHLPPLLLLKSEMSVINLDTLVNDKLKKKIAALVSLDSWSNECGNYKRHALLHKGGPCRR